MLNVEIGGGLVNFVYDIYFFIPLRLLLNFIDTKLNDSVNLASLDKFYKRFSCANYHLYAFLWFIWESGNF